MKTTAPTLQPCLKRGVSYRKTQGCKPQNNYGTKIRDAIKSQMRLKQELERMKELSVETQYRIALRQSKTQNLVVQLLAKLQ
jgi:hypothetical protein